ncbi:MAG: hypothetical protein KBG28_12945 [Kofleriaceae bacterium]|jgi:hypothetical protein|nr:hypothetical protein [Kofleriaceae bacterium]MBP6838390.1 hypothetical protein [Kofleriaceae bacterium]MBP9204870.1 hypothetical protein [Kofleriaceae bacterium]
MGHRSAELRSLALHRAVAARLTPALLQEALARLAWAEHAGTTHPRYLAAWRALLAEPVAVVAAALVRDDEHMRALRQTTPFVGVLSPQERWRVLAEARS